MRYNFVVIVFLFIAVVTSTAQQTPFDLACGDILDGELLPTEDQERTYNEYVLDVSGGTRIDLAIVPLGENFNVGFVFLDFAGTELQYYNEQPDGITEGVEDFSIGGSSQRIRVYGMKPSFSSDADSINDRSEFFHPNRGNGGNYLGAYQISLGCVLRDGRRMNPGDNITSDSGTEQTIPQPVFSGFGFPGLAPIDFSAGIEIPITAGQAQTAPIGGDVVALYTYDATASQTANLSLSRVSGDISVGVSVIKRDTNEIVFVGGMPSSNNLSVELTFPSDGTYVIGLFRMDTAEKVDTSGAVQVMIE